VLSAADRSFGRLLTTGNLQPVVFFGHQIRPPLRRPPLKQPPKQTRRQHPNCIGLSSMPGRAGDRRSTLVTGQALLTVAWALRESAVLALRLGAGLAFSGSCANATPWLVNQTDIR
jgi:hypothetical protein